MISSKDLLEALFRSEGEYVKFSSLVWNYSVNDSEHGRRKGFGISSQESEEDKAKMFFNAFSKTKNSMDEFTKLHNEELAIIQKRKALLQTCRDEYTEWFENSAKQEMPELFI